MFPAILSLAWPALAEVPPCKNPKISINAESMSDADEKDFELNLRAAIRKVCNWWGPTFSGNFKITIEDSRGPSMALAPG